MHINKEICNITYYVLRINSKQIILYLVRNLYNIMNNMHPDFIIASHSKILVTYLST